MRSHKWLRSVGRRPLALALLMGLSAAGLRGAGSAMAHEGHEGPEMGPNDPNAPRRLSEAAIRNGGITLAEVTTRAIERVITVPGRVAPRPESVYDLHAPVAGFVLEVEAVPGQTLVAGATVARLGGAALAAIVGDWERLRRESKGAEDASALLSSLVDREALMAVEGRRLELLAAAAAYRSAAGDLEGARRAGDALPERERRTREAAETEARTRLEVQRARLRAAGISTEELARLESAPVDRPTAETLGLDPAAAAKRFFPLAEHAADAVGRAKESSSLAAALHASTLKIRLTGLAIEDIEGVAKGAEEPSVPLRTRLGGVVRSVGVHAGHWVEAGAEVAELIDPASVQVEAEVPESDFGRVRVGAVARIRRGGRPDLSIDGTIRWVSPAVDPATRRFRAVVDLLSPREVPIDLGVDVVIVTDKLEEAKSVPVGAILAEGAERYVYKEKDGAFVRTPIVVGLRDDRFAQVLDGLYSGEKVVATGAELVRDTPPIAPTAKPAAKKP